MWTMERLRVQRGAVLWAVVLCAAATLVDAKEAELTCADRELAALPFCDASLPPEQRVSDLRFERALPRRA